MQDSQLYLVDGSSDATFHCQLYCSNLLYSTCCNSGSIVHRCFCCRKQVICVARKRNISDAVQFVVLTSVLSAWRSVILAVNSDRVVLVWLHFYIAGTVTFLVPAHLGSPGQRAVKWVCVCVCVADDCTADSVSVCTIYITRADTHTAVNWVQFPVWELISTGSRKQRWRELCPDFIGH